VPEGELWAAALEAQPGFGPAYAAYLHCRTRGWLIRSGLQYGADYVLYPRHPSLSHSTLTALVIPPKNGPGSSSGAAAAARDGWPSWPELQALSRLCVQVNKGLLLLHVRVSCDDGRGGGGEARAAGRAAEAAAAREAGLRAGAHGYGSPGASPVISAHLARLEVLEAEVSRWNPAKGRVEPSILA